MEDGYENVPDSWPAASKRGKYYQPVEENPSSLSSSSSSNSDVYETFENPNSKKARSVFGYDLSPPSAAAGYENESEASLNVAAAIGKSKDWNKEFQSLREEPDSEAKFTRLRHLGNDFVYVATTGAKIIISELHSERKTIQPVNLGGRAGGDKYVYRNILFKFAMDVELANGKGWMYGGNQPSDERAMKAAANELRGLMHYASLHIKQLHFPMMVVIDYKGFRIIAQSVLPINKETIRYGSSDGGDTVFCDSDKLNQIMEDVGKRLYLAPHMVNGKKIYGPGDQEVHEGSDFRFYCIDLARVFPCEAPPKPGLRPDPTLDPRAVFYNLLRPEFLLSYGKPLDSDAYSGWGKMDPNFKAHNAAVYEATQHLFRTVVPKFAKELDDLDKALSTSQSSSLLSLFKSLDLISRLHRAGLNVRHLGRLRTVVKSPRIKCLLLNETAARILKNIIRSQFRALMERIKYLSSEQVRECVTAAFNAVLRNIRRFDDNANAGASSSRADFSGSTDSLSSSSSSSSSPPLADIFDDEFKSLLCIKFRECLSAEERLPSFDLAATIDIELFFHRLQQMLGLVLSDDAKTEIRANNTSFEFVYCDIVEVNPKVRFMNILDEAEGMSLLMTALRNPKPKRRRLLKLAADKFENASRSFPNNDTALLHLAQALYYEARLLEDSPHLLPEYCTILSKATAKLQSVLHLDPKHVDAHWWLMKVLMLRVSAEPTQTLMKQLASEMSHGTLICASSYPKLMSWAQRKVEILFERSDRTRSEDMLAGVCALTSTLHNSYLLLSERLNSAVSSSSSTNPLAATGITAVLAQNNFLQARNLFIWANALIIQAELNKRNHAASVLQAAGGSSPRTSREHHLQQSSSNSKLLPWSEGVQNLNSKLMRFHAADKFAELLTIEDPRIMDLMLQELVTIADLAQNSYSLKTKLDSCICSLKKMELRTCLTSSRIPAARLTTPPASPNASEPAPLCDWLLSTIGPSMTNLTDLDLSCCSVRPASVVSCLTRLSAMRSLSLAQMTPLADDSYITPLAKLTSLTKLDIHSSNISSVSMDPFLQARGTNLRELNLGKTKLDLQFLMKIAELCPTLESLNIFHLLTEVTFVDLLENKKAQNLWPSRVLPTSLRHLHLLDCIGISNGFMEFIATSLTSLEDLRLGAKKVTDPGMIPLAGIAPNLTVLHFKGMNTSEIALERILMNLTGKTTELSLIACLGLTDAALSALNANAAANIKVLDLSSCNSIQGFAFDHLLEVKKMVSVTDLDVSFMQSCKRQSLVKFISSQKMLQILDISHCETLDSDQVVASIVAQLPALSHLSAESMENIGSKSLAALATSCPAISHLNLNDCKSITAEGLRQLGRCRSLKRLKLRHIIGLSKEFIESLALEMLLESVQTGGISDSRGVLARSDQLKM